MCYCNASSKPNKQRAVLKAMQYPKRISTLFIFKQGIVCFISMEMANVLLNKKSKQKNKLTSLLFVKKC